MTSSFAVPCPPFRITLSQWDRVFPHWGKIFPPKDAVRVYCFAVAPDVDKQAIVNQLHLALQSTVHKIPFLGGALVLPSAKDKPWDVRLVSDGAARLDVQDLSDRQSFAELAKFKFAQHMFPQDIFPPVNDALPPGSRVSLCRIQATWIDGGLLLVTSVNHTVADGRGVTEIVKIFADAFCKAQLGEISAAPATNQEEYVSDRTQSLAGSGTPGSVDAYAAWTSAPAITTTKQAKVQSCSRVYRIDPDALVALKNAATCTPASAASRLSTNDAISAFIWRSVLLARHRAGLVSANELSHIAQPIDYRAKVGLDGAYHGNVMYMTQGSLPFSELSHPRTGIVTAAQAIRAQVQSASADKFRDMLAHAEYVENRADWRLRIVDDILTSGLIVTSHFRFPLYDIDFGPAVEGGRAKAFRFPARESMIGTAVIFPRLPDSSCEFMVTEQLSTMNLLAADDMFCQFTGVEHSPLPTTPPMSQSFPPTPALSDMDSKPGQSVHSELSPPSAPGTHGLGLLGEAGEACNPEQLHISDLPALHTGTIRVITLNRPRAKNAFTVQMMHQLYRELDRIHTEWARGVTGTRVLILASALDDVFCTGADLKQRLVMNDAQVDEFLGAMRRTLAHLETLPIPAVAAVAGAALGGGLELALCCHLRVFSSGAVVGLPETRLGVIPGAGGTYRLPRVVGLGHARDLILTGRRVGATEALAMGLCDRVVDHDDGDMALGIGGGGTSAATPRQATLQAAIELAREVSAGAPLAIQAAMTVLSCASSTMESTAYASLLHTADRMEGLMSFREKRPARFVGK
ncbi:hypothetical protein LMH87_002012 [Akanthomyces muscarius]|uniref:Enoyl-CoA hydratase/isomerase n=1 Tax=Akanthomyces muscarius TaxID=2231603 RepID=A0A9W8Q6V4_AKAMU|nr:hypothetical protein LMH87_002012 [Akanthomyces muscarius]KAJ4147499.1 hypothetical protein LMH87_002012 [Akanthomyces muscarius]